MSVCAQKHIWGGSLTANVSSATGFISFPIYTHICICSLGDRGGFLGKDTCVLSVITNRN